MNSGVVSSHDMPVTAWREYQLTDYTHGNHPDGSVFPRYSRTVGTLDFERDVVPSRQDQLLERAERMLLMSKLTPVQVRSLDEHGYFELPWPDQHRVLKVHTTRFPTVDSYYMRHRGITESWLGTGRHQWSIGAYLGSMDVRYVDSSVKEQLPSTASTPSGFARLVLEAHRVGLLTQLLTSAEVTRCSNEQILSGWSGRSVTHDRKCGQN